MPSRSAPVPGKATVRYPFRISESRAAAFPPHALPSKDCADIHWYCRYHRTWYSPHPTPHKDWWSNHSTPARLPHLCAPRTYQDSTRRSSTDLRSHLQWYSSRVPAYAHAPLSWGSRAWYGCRISIRDHVRTLPAAQSLFRLRQTEICSLPEAACRTRRSPHRQTGYTGTCPASCRRPLRTTRYPPRCTPSPRLSCALPYNPRWLLPAPRWQSCHNNHNCSSPSAPFSSDISLSCPLFLFSLM